MKIIIIILQVIGGLTLIPWFGVAGLSFMAFDDPESYKKIAPWVFIASIFAYPFVLGMSFWKSWEEVSISNLDSALVFTCIPILIFAIAYLVITRGSNLYGNISEKYK